MLSRSLRPVRGRLKKIPYKVWPFAKLGGVTPGKTLTPSPPKAVSLTAFSVFLTLPL